MGRKISRLKTLQWRHNEYPGVLNHRRLDFLFNFYLDEHHRKYQSTGHWHLVRRIHRWPVNSPHKWPVTRKKLPYDIVIMRYEWLVIVFGILGIFRMPILQQTTWENAYKSLLFSELAPRSFLLFLYVKMVVLFSRLYVQIDFHTEMTNSQCDHSSYATGPAYLQGLTLIKACMNSHMPSKV